MRWAADYELMASCVALRGRSNDALTLETRGGAVPQGNSSLGSFANSPAHRFGIRA
jgi:hypothetical protein